MHTPIHLQKKAMTLYHTGQTQSDVCQMLIDAGIASTEVEALAEKYYQDYLFLQKEIKKEGSKKAQQDLWVGSVFLGSGLLLTLFFSFATEEGQPLVLFWGLMALGAFLLGRGLWRKFN